MFLHCWLYSSLETTNLLETSYGLYIVVYLSISIFLLYLLIISSTIFIGILLLLLLFLVQIMLLYFSGQHLFALFLLGVYVGAILVFFIFVVMSFIFFGKTYKLTYRLWSVYVILPFGYALYGYITVLSTSDSSAFFIYNIFSMYPYSFDELRIVGMLLFDVDMMYVVLVVSLLLLVALLGSITFNASSLVRYSSSFYYKG